MTYMPARYSCRCRRDRCLKAIDAVERAASDGLFGDDAQEDFDHVQSGATRRRETQGDPGTLSRPGLYVRVFAGGIVVAQCAVPRRGGAAATRPRKSTNSAFVCFWKHLSAEIFPVAISNAANRVVVPFLL
jgi:hypothetical protein